MSMVEREVGVSTQVKGVLEKERGAAGGEG